MTVLRIRATRDDKSEMILQPIPRMELIPIWEFFLKRDGIWSGTGQHYAWEEIVFY